MRYFHKPIQQVGWCFVLATAAGVLSVLVMMPTLGADDLLATVYANQNSLLAGQVLIFVMLAAMTATAALLYPILRAQSETLALGYVLARTLEVAVISIGMVAGLLLIPLSWNGSGDQAGAELVAETLKTASDWSGYLGAQMIFSLSALILNWALYRFRLVPRWLSSWGLFGVPLMFASGLLVMFESLSDSTAALNLLVVPLAIQEMAMAFWMIFKGFADKVEHLSAVKPSATEI